jgi:hypothetical protein
MTTPKSTTHLRPPANKASFRTVKLLVGSYLALSVLTVATVIVLSQLAPDLVNPEAWVRSIIVAATSLLTFRFATRAAQRTPRALLRLRIVVSILLIAIIAVLLFLPLPLWMVIEQCVCGLLLLATTIIIFGKGVAATG